MKSLPRTFVHLVYDDSRIAWLAKVERCVVGVYVGNQTQAVKRLAPHLDWMWKQHKVRSELVVHSKNDGKRITSRRTYGEDPKGRG